MRIPPATNGWLCSTPSFPIPFLPKLLCFLFLLVSPMIIKAEGSKDFISSPGYRMFLDTRDTQQLKVYADVGEFINIGSSHLGIQGGFIQVFRPDGVLAATFNGNVGSNGIIYNDIQEAAGPTGGGTTNGSGYIPEVIEVLPGQEGIWSVYFGYPTYSAADFANILNSDSWNRNDDQPNTPRVVLAWDITVSQLKPGNENGILQTGRVFTNEYVSIINQNGFNTSPSFFVLTKGGFIYKVDFTDADPFRFPISSNTAGFLHHDLQPVYMSQQRSMIVRSADPDSWVPGSYYLYEPQAEDYNNGEIVNNKIFFNEPDDDMPATARTTDVFRNNTHTTWLFIEPASFIAEISGFKLTANGSNNLPCNEGYMQTGVGGWFDFESNVGGTASLFLDLNDDGDFNDSGDRVIYQQVNPGQNLVFWDGKDGLGNDVPANSGFELNYELKIRGGETHMLLTDVENNEGGVNFTLFNNIPNGNPDEFYYDHTPINGPVSGGGAPGNPLPTTVPFTYTNNFGNAKILDYWAFFDYNGGDVGTLNIVISDDCQEPPVTTPVGPDRDGDGIPDRTDIDDDNDGIPDNKEYCNGAGGGFLCLPSAIDPSHDEDEDGILNFMDADDPAYQNPCNDANNDGLCDNVPGIFDTDGDGVPDHYDLDSDNDGITDLVEAGHNQPDNDGNGVIDGPNNIFGLNGLYNPISSDPDDLNAVETYVRLDKDVDLVPDHDDLDSDNDGIHDVAEAGYALSDSNNDGRIDDGFGNPPATGPTGLAPFLDPLITGLPIPLPPDKDGDLVPDWHDLDSDNDLIHDVEEGGHADQDNDAIIGTGTPAVNQNGQAIGGGIISNSRPPDTDNDFVPDFHDLDTDNDGINDVREANGIDPDNDGLPGTGTLQVNADGIPATDNVGNSLNPTSIPEDTDGDLIRDYRDLDSDNDIINDVAETNLPDDDNDGKVGIGNPPVNDDGQIILLPVTSNPTDTDGDGIPDFRELDSDNDGVDDVTEANKSDPDFDGIIGTGIPVVGPNGQAINFLATSKPTDTDGDDTPDFQEIDSDDDGLLDNEECPNDTPCRDWDNDGTADFQDPDRDDDGISDFYECETTTPCPDTDGDGIPDLDDLDTDGDGIADVDECPDGEPCPDVNNNGIPEWREFFCNPNVVLPELSAASGGGDFCEGSSTVLSATNNVDVVGDSVTYVWSGPNGFSYTGSTSEFGQFSVSITDLSSNEAGEYTLFVFTEEGCASGPETVTVNIGNTPLTPELQVANDQYCIGETLELNSSIYTGADISYQWFFNDGSGPMLLGMTDVPTFFLNNLNVGNTGIYSVQVSIGNCGSLMSNSQDINVSNVYSQTPVLSVSNDDLCIGEMLELNSSIVQGNNVVYEWWFDDGNGAVSLGTTNVPTLFIDNTTISNSGIYNVTVQVGNCTSQFSNSQDVSINDDMLGFTPVLSVNQDLLCEGQTIELNSTPYTGTDVIYEWWFDNGNGAVMIGSSDVPTFFIQNATLDQTGVYTVMVSNGNCNSQFSNVQDIVVSNDLLGIAPELSVDQDVLCEGQGIELNSSAYSGINVQYEWFFDDGNGPVSLGLTNIPTYFIQNATLGNTGIYTVSVTIGQCQSLPSNAQDITVTDNFNAETPELSVVDDNPCEGESIELNSSIFNGSNISYNWWFDDGSGPVLLATTNVPTYFIDNVNNDNTGNYAVTVNIGNCETQFSNLHDITVTDDLSNVTPELISNQNDFCEGEMLELNSAIINGGNVSYEWFFDDGSGLVSLGITNVPTYFINDLSLSNAGNYTVEVTVGNCTSQPSNVQNVSVTDDLTSQTPALEISQSIICEGEMVELNSSIFTGGNVMYEWFFDDGTGPVSIGITNIPTFFIDNLSTANSGVYTVEVTVGNCTTQPSNAQDLMVSNALGSAPSLSINDDLICEGELIELNSSMIGGNEVAYQWWFDDGSGAVLIGLSDNPTFFIDNASALNSGVYTVIVHADGCQSQLSNAQDVSVEPMPDLQISNSTDAQNVACPGDIIELSVPMMIGATYQWGGPLGFTSNQVNPIIENASSQNAGEYYVLVETEGCMFLSEPSEVFVWDELLAEDDEYFIDFGETLTSEDFIINDYFGNIGEWTIDIVNSPSNGDLELDSSGLLIYTPRSEFGGSDVFTYEICNIDCPDQCTEALVTVRVNNEFEEEGCFIPNIITPNDDGANDRFEINCLDTEFTDNSLKIFNRWGDLVYQAQPYENDWSGTYRGTQLPPGIYFYVLQLDVKEEECKQGYFTITR